MKKKNLKILEVIIGKYYDPRKWNSFLKHKTDIFSFIIINLST